MSCQLHRRHIPMPLRTVWHHLQPLGMGGADTAANKIETCDNGHYSVHRLLGDLIRTGRMRLGGTRTERRAALTGYQAWIAAGKPGTPVFELHPEETS